LTKCLLGADRGVAEAALGAWVCSELLGSCTEPSGHESGQALVQTLCRWTWWLEQSIWNRNQYVSRQVHVCMFNYAKTELPMCYESTSQQVLCTRAYFNLPDTSVMFHLDLFLKLTLKSLEVIL
jgi:hypothetical protein